MVDLLNELSKWMKVKTDIAEVGWDVAVGEVLGLLEKGLGCTVA